MECCCAVYVALASATIFASLKLIQRYWMLSGIHQRPVLVTGCDSGFGKLLALDLYKKGVTVYAGCFLKESVDEFRTSCGSRLKPIRLDISNSDSVYAAVQYVASDLGEKALWAVVNNAGISGTIAPFEWTTKDDFRKAFEVNLLGPHDVIRNFLPLLRREKQGRIVNMASALGRVTFAAGAYSTSKYALESFSDGLSYELEPFNISVHVLEPNAFKTQIISMDSQMKSLPLAMAQTKADIRELYGGEEYLKRFIEHNVKSMNKSASDDPHLVVKAYEHALFARFPQTRYQVGFWAKWIIIPMSFLPLRIQKIIQHCLAELSGGPAPIPKCSH